MTFREWNYIDNYHFRSNSKLRTCYGAQKDLLLKDNNILASIDLDKIINEIIDCDFGKNVIILKNSWNDAAYTKKVFNLNIILLNRLQSKIYKTIAILHKLLR